MDSLIYYLPTVTVRSQLIYTSVLLTVVTSLAALPFVYVDVSVQAAGLVRPIAERSEIKSLVSGRIATVLVHENQPIRAGSALVQLQSDVLATKLRLLATQQIEKQQYVHDLQMLLRQNKSILTDEAKLLLSNSLASSLYRQQYDQFRFIANENLQTQAKRQRELATSRQLYADKVIARIELEDKEFELNTLIAQYKTLVERQRSDWQTALTQQQLALIELRAQERQLQQERELYTIRASVGGTVSQVAGRYSGSYVQAGEVIGMVSPDSTLLVDCYILPKDIGLVRPNQQVRFQIDAFDYNQWGLIEGKVLDIANDFTVSTKNGDDTQPVFKVRCQLDRNYLTLSNGYRGQLKKGMTLRARFVVTQRSLFQLLYDNADDWLNPVNSPL